MRAPEQAGASIEAVLDTAAWAYAKRWNLIGQDGLLWCAACVEAHALLPSLHCGPCLGAAYARLGIVQPACLNREQEGVAA